MVGRPDAIGSLVESVAGHVHGRSVNRQGDGRLARTSATFSSRQSSRGSSQRVYWAYSHPDFLGSDPLPQTLADRALVAAFEVARGAGEGELLLSGSHRR